MKTFSASRLWIAIVVVVLAAGLVIGDDAMAWGKKKSNGPKDPRGKAVNLDLMPEMQVTRGMLQRDAFGQWTLDEQPLSFDKNSRIGETDDDEGRQQLAAGQEATVFGSKLGESLLVYRLVIVSQQDSIERGMLYPRPVLGEPAPLPSGAPQ